MDVAAPVPPKEEVTNNPRSTWTVMVYLAGDNNLTDECVYALTEMKKALGSGRIRVFAQFDPKDDHLPTHRYEINSGGKVTPLGRDVSDKWPFKRESRHHYEIPEPRGLGAVPVNDSPTGDGRTLFNFLSYIIETSPADHYMVILAGHAGGTETGYLLKDDSPSGYLTLDKVKWVFDKLREKYYDVDGNPLVIDIVGMDVCLMNMAEVCYELKGNVKVVIGCESYSPASGWPFQSIIKTLEECADPQQVADFAAARLDVADEFAKRAVADYVNFYSDYSLGGLSVDQSALNVRNVDTLMADVGGLAAAMSQELDNPQTREAFTAELILAHWDAQSYNGELFVDIVDFCNCLIDRYGGTGVANVAGAVRDSILQNFILRSCYSGPKYQYSYGVSIYFPWDEIALSYEKSRFATESGWFGFLEKYTAYTRRAPRDVGIDTEIWGANKRKIRKTEGRKTEGMGPGNEIHSMRNPPIAALPSVCLSGENATHTETEVLIK